MTIEKLIMQSLQRGELLNSELIKSIQRLRPGTTKQGVYRILKKLAKDEVIIMHNKSSALNLNWIFETQEFLALAQFNYSKQSNNSLNFLTLKEKNKIVYYFTSLLELDAFWNQVLYILNETIPNNEPLFAYNPHQWFFYSRNKNEQNLIKAFQIKSRKCLVSLVHKDTLNINLKRNYSGEDVQYAFESKLYLDKPNLYFNIIGEFLIETFIDLKINDKLDKFFIKHKVYSEEAQQELDEIVRSSGKHKMVISNNSKKISLYKNHMAKKFAIKIR